MRYANKKNCSLRGLKLGLLAMFLLQSNIVSASLLHDQVASNKQFTFYLSLHPKPSSPITVRLQAVKEPVLGQVNEFKLTVTTKIDVVNLVTSVKLPAGWTLQTGSSNWQGALLQGQTKELRFSVSIPALGQYTLVARAVVGDKANGQLSAVNSYAIGQDQSSKLQAVSAQRYRFAARNGQQLIQYKIP